MKKTNCDIREQRYLNTLNYNILIIEDSKTVNKILTTSLSRLGYNCFSTEKLSDGREILKNNTINYVMLNINLADGDGNELIKEFENSSEKFFILTMETDREFKNMEYKKGVVDFIVKDKRLFNKIDQISNSIKQLEKNKLKTILVVDDSLVIQEQLKSILKNRHYSVEVAPDAVTALEIIRTKDIDLMLLDILLKKSNGIEFLYDNQYEIIEEKKIPVMIISGNVDSLAIRDGLKAGAVDIIRKPYAVEEIVLKVDLWIDYKRKEEEVLCSTQLLKEYKDAVDESSIVSKTTPQGVITFVNEKFCELSGYTLSELIGKNHNIVRHPDMSKDVFKDLWHTIKELKQTWQGKVKNRTKSGGYYWVDALIKPILDRDGKIVEFIGLRTDITQIEQYKEILKDKLNNSDKSLKENLNYTAQYEDANSEFTAILKTDINNIITYSNNMFCKLSGYLNEELVGTNCKDLRHENHIKVGDCEKIKERMQENKHIKIVFTNVAKDGSLYFIDTIVYPIVDINGEVIEHLHLMHDITELTNLHKEIEDTQKEIVYKMGEIGESRSKETGHHVKRVAEYSILLARLYGLSEYETNILFIASPMHDIGKVGISDSILKKPGKLTDEEFDIMKSHTDIGYSILKGSSREVLKAASIVAYEHHEKYNGRGYPKGLKGDEIHIFGRITAIADVFDALGSDRCYKKAWKDEKIFKLLEEERGEQFDPDLVDLFMDNRDKFIDIRDKYKD